VLIADIMRFADRLGVAAAIVLPGRRLRRLAVGLHFDHGLNAVEIQRIIWTCNSIRTVQMLLLDSTLRGGQLERRFCSLEQTV
jgi:hypothetical protein